MKVSLYTLSGRSRDDIRRCAHCEVLADDDTAFICGWHENLVAATRVVDNLAADLLDGNR